MTKRRIGLISDTHGLLRPAALRTLQGVEAIVHAGDIGETAILTTLRTIAPVTAVRGNVDTGRWAQGLPRIALLDLDPGRLCVLHDLRALAALPDLTGVTVVVSGHSHQPAREERNGVLFVNPGSAGPRRFTAPVCLALLHVRGAAVEVEFVRLDDISKEEQPASWVAGR
jgi:putative phosphoesterase